MSNRPASFEWKINHDHWKDLLSCMPDPVTKYKIMWAANNPNDIPVGFVVYRESVDRESGYLGEYNFDVSVQMTDLDVLKGFKLCSLHTDIEEAKELAFRDYEDNIFKTGS